MVHGKTVSHYYLHQNTQLAQPFDHSRAQRFIMLTLIFVALLGARCAEGKAPEGNILTASQDRCTSIIAGAKAGVDGPMTTHTNDCADCDFRLAKVPARDWPVGSKRPLYLYKGSYPVNIMSDRGDTWLPSNLEGSPEQLAVWNEPTPVTGYIPQVNHTFALLEGHYGIINEHQVAIGESTCAARFWAPPTVAGGMARIEARQMSQIALERSTTAREAVQLMGDLAVKYGFYAANWEGGDGSYGEGGEALTVIDKTEAWMFHVLGDDTGTSAIWVAQKVQPDHVSVVANQFVIRAVDPKSKDFMYSNNLWEVAIRHNLWSRGDPPLDFLKTYGLARAHSPYATRRVWRVFSLVAPSIVLPGHTNEWGDDYPFSVKAEVPLTAQDLMRIQGDHYEGTEFDMTKGLASGPYGDPNRWDAAEQEDLTSLDIVQGAYERSISLFRASYSIVAQSRAAVPNEFSLLWFGSYAPATTSYVPFYVTMDKLPEAYTTGSLHKYDSKVAFWNFCAAGNYAGRFYRFAIRDIQALQASLMTTAMAAIRSTETKLVGSTDLKVIRESLTAVSMDHAAKVVTAWRDLLPQLITKYHDGYEAQNTDTPDLVMNRLFYPKYWLDATGFWLNKPNLGPEVLLFDANPAATASTTSSSSTVIMTVLVTAVMSSLVTLLLTAYVLRRNKTLAARHQYVSIDL